MSKVFFVFHGLESAYFFSFFSIFLSFWREKKGSFPSFFLLFSFWGGEGAGDRKNEVFFLFLLFFLFFCFFSPSFHSFFRFWSRKWGRNGVRMNSDLFPFEFLFMEKNQGSNWKFWRKFFLFFFLIFFLLFAFSAFFFSVLGKGNEGEWREMGG